MSLRENLKPKEDFELPGDEPSTPFPEDLGDAPPVIESEPTLNLDDLGLDLPSDAFTGTEDSGGGFDFGDLLGDGGFGTDSSVEPPSIDEDSPPDDPFSGFSDPMVAGNLPIESGFPIEDGLPTENDLPIEGGLSTDETIPPAEDTFTDAGENLSEDFPTEDFSMGDIPLDDISAEDFSAGPEESPDFEDIILGKIPIDDVDEVNMDDTGSMETPAGESDFSDIEFPDIDLTQT
ncbi:MAG: hypothetical protein FWG29_04380, partial [Treponema sp.]|nr:hypothetical protein [Treponema sp.]